LALADVDSGAQLLVLDEPTASLPARDAERFLEAVKLAATHRIATLLVTHRLVEIFDIAHRVTVVRDGRVVRVSDVAGLTHDDLVREIVGTEGARVTAEARDGSVRRSARFEPRLERSAPEQPLLQ